jgi:hypothetical protein
MKTLRWPRESFRQRFATRTLQRLDDRQAGTVHHQRHGVTASAGPDYVQGLVADPAGPDLISEGRVEDARAPDRVPLDVWDGPGQFAAASPVMSGD